MKGWQRRSQPAGETCGGARGGLFKTKDKSKKTKVNIKDPLLGGARGGLFKTKTSSIKRANIKLN